MQELYKHFLKYPEICTDTRDIKKGAIFFALKGDNFNANQFAEKALSDGCSFAVIDERQYKKDDRYLLVEDVLLTLQQLANYHRKQLTIPVIAITGSNGKTTSKELVNAVLSEKYKVLATKGNLNNHIGVPLTLLSIKKDHEMAIIEMGANHQGEIAMLCKLAEPNYGMITNIGKAHLEGFGGAEGVVKAKNELYDYIKQRNGKLFVNADNELLMKLSGYADKITFGVSENAMFKGVLIENDPFIKLSIKSRSDSPSATEKLTIQTALIGKYNFENILAAACIGHYFKVAENQIKNGLEKYVPSNNRSQVMQTKDNLVLLDAYNANPSSMNAAIENFAQMNRPQKIVILGDMLELGEESEKEHTQIIELLKQKKISQAIFVGPHFMKAAHSSFPNSFQTSDQALNYIKEHPIKNATVLVKGSRGIKLEKLVEAL
ncbi:MAG TPA: UDP-N-acetylmuramoyl-tripeptide--D-alanyl-D-alanine ligase [Bacteroidia bacterium]|nr:UDP-N-acetylmuramoyl-tripeptide--D-alanyl-D-alanine ligase [Bacteroidia bacterium]